MEKYIKYKRFSKDVIDDKEIQLYFDDLVQGGWNIIHYEEKIKDLKTLTLTVIVGKKQSNIL